MALVLNLTPFRHGRKEEIGPLRFDTGSMIKEINIRKKMPEIAEKGFIISKRKGDTGIGYTLEEELGIAENNERIQDLIFEGKKVELKAQRRSTVSPVTLFTKEPKKPGLSDRSMLEKYGYSDKDGRRALKVTLKADQPNLQGLELKINTKEGKLSIAHMTDGDLWFWDTSSLKLKIDNLLLAFADSKRVGETESFHYNEAYYLSDFDQEKFFKLIDSGKIVVDLRMHLKSSGAVRNHGTAFRGKFQDFKVCYNKQESLSKLKSWRYWR